jgi:hypothetical protein
VTGYEQHDQQHKLVMCTVKLSTAAALAEQQQYHKP